MRTRDLSLIAADRSQRFGRTFNAPTAIQINPTNDSDINDTIRSLHDDGLFFLIENDSVYLVPDGNVAGDRPFQAAPGADAVTIVTKTGDEQQVRWIPFNETFYAFTNRVLQVGAVAGAR